MSDAQAALVDAVDESFHCISVDGHMSTNDTVILLANGAAVPVGRRVRSATPLTGKALADFRTTLLEVCEDLAQVDSRRRRRGHASDHRRSPRLPIAGRRAADQQDDRRQPAGENGDRRRRPELGPHRLGRRLRRRAVRSRRR